MSYGEKIAKLRREKGITQVTLGQHLNVTYQAVSKWERDESDPDFATMNKIAKYFGVPLSYFTDDGGALSEAAVTSAASAYADSSAASAAQPSQPPARDTYSGAQQTISPAGNPTAPVGNTGNAQQDSHKPNKNKQVNKKSAPMRRNVGLIVGGVAALAVLITLIVMFSMEQTDFLTAFIGCFILTLLTFTFVSQLFWVGVIIDIILWGFKIIGTPGIIFSFDLDGFIFLIGMKILFAILKIVVLFLLVFVAILFAIIASPFTFIPQLIAINKDEL